MAVPAFPSLTKKLPFIRSPEWQSLKHRSVSGKVTALQQQAAPIWHYTASYDLMRANAPFSEFQTMIGFYNSVGGDAQLWSFDDPDDDTVTAQTFGIGDGATTAFQLVRALGGFIEPIFIPTTLTVFIAGVPTGAYSQAGGLVKFNAAPNVNSIVSWTGTFSWPCRFDDGKIDFSKFGDGYWTLDKLSFSTEPLST